MIAMKKDATDVAMSTLIDHDNLEEFRNPASYDLEESPVNTRVFSLVLAAFLVSHPLVAHAQYIPPWLVAAALSPILVLALCAVLGFVSRSLRRGLVHGALIVLWVVLFSLAAYFIENDYIIWTPLALYILHSALLMVLIVVEIARRENA